MDQLDLTGEELSALADILDSTLSDLRSEIIDTDNYSYKEMLKKREQMLTSLFKKIQKINAATQQK